MRLHQLLPHLRLGCPAVRKGSPEPTLVFFFAEDFAAFQRLHATEPRLSLVHFDQDEAPEFPILLEAWDGGAAWSSQIPLSLALAEDWEKG